jgi:PAS domain S-box-containing protein
LPVFVVEIMDNQDILKTGEKLKIRDQQFNLPAVLDELTVVANENLPVVDSLQKMIGLIGSAFGWLQGRIVMRSGILVMGQEVIVWDNPDAPPLLQNDLNWNHRPIHHLVAEGRSVIVDDIQAGLTSGLNFTDLPPEVRGYLAYPIRPEGVFIGVVEFFSDAPLPHTPESQSLLSYGVALMTLVMERGRARMQLRTSENRFRAIFDQSYQFISLLEPDGTFIEVNDTALEFCEMTAEELVGNKYWERAWWQDREDERRRLQALVKRAAAGELVRFEAELDGKNGEILYADFTLKPIFNRQGQVVQLISEGHDITALRHSLHHLKLAEGRLEEAQRIAKIGHWDYDLVREKATWSKTLLDIFGLDPAQEFNIEVLLNLVHPEDFPNFNLTMERAATDGQSYEHHFRIIRPDGVTRTIFAAGGMAENQAGERVRLSGIIQDITGRQRLEESLARTVDRLSRLNTMVQTVASSLDQTTIYRDVLSAGRALLQPDALVLFLHENGDLVISAVEQEGELNLLGLRLPEHAGVAGKTFTTGETVWLTGEECRRRRSNHLAAASGFEPGSIVAVPVRWQDTTFGVLEAVDLDQDAFTDDDVRLLQSIAIWTAIAINNAHQHQSLARRLKESEAIAVVSRSLSETLETEDVLDLIVRTTHNILPKAEWVIVHLLQGRPERLIPTAAAGVDHDLHDYIIEPDQGAAGLALGKGEPVNIADTNVDPILTPFAYKSGLRSLLVVPVQTRNHRLGTISLFCREREAFTQEDERLLTILAAQAGLAIENAQLFESQRRARMVAEVQRERLKILTERLVTAQEEERLRISRELHDGTGQALTSLKISLDLLQKALSPEQTELRASLSDLAALTGDTMDNLRNLAHDLRPPGLDTFGLHVALQGLCGDFSSRTGLPHHYEGIDLPGLPNAVALSLYRFVQEALTNVAKHAEARNVTVRLMREKNALVLSVDDDGRGFRMMPDIRGGGIGLMSMEERAELLGGVLDIDTEPGRGTCLTAKVPFDYGPQNPDRGEDT